MIPRVQRRSYCTTGWPLAAVLVSCQAPVVPSPSGGGVSGVIVSVLSPVGSGRALPAATAAAAAGLTITHDVRLLCDSEPSLGGTMSCAEQTCVPSACSSSSAP